MAANGAYKLKVPVQARFRDTDAMGHINNAVYLTYLELARMRYWEAVTGVRDFRKVDFILAHVTIDYKSPGLVDEDLEVWIRVSELKRSSFTCDYRIVEKKGGRLVAEARTVQACYDYASGKVKRLGDETRRAIAEFENDPSLFSTLGKVEKELEEGGEGG